MGIITFDPWLPEAGAYSNRKDKTRFRVSGGQHLTSKFAQAL